MNGAECPFLTIIPFLFLLSFSKESFVCSHLHMGMLLLCVFVTQAHVMKDGSIKMADGEDGEETEEVG